MAKSIAILLGQNQDTFDPTSFLQQLIGITLAAGMKRKLQRLLSHVGSARWASIVWSLDDDEDESAGAMIWEPNPRKKRWFQIRATSAVSIALWSFLDNVNNPEEAICAAVGLGGDTDTIGSMCGALCGALHGDTWLPERWLQGMENGLHGRDSAIRLARSLSRLDLKEPTTALVDADGHFIAQDKCPSTQEVQESDPIKALMTQTLMTYREEKRQANDVAGI